MSNQLLGTWYKLVVGRRVKLLKEFGKGRGKKGQKKEGKTGVKKQTDWVSKEKG